LQKSERYLTSLPRSDISFALLPKILFELPSWRNW